MNKARGGQPALDVALSLDETYADVAPVREGSDGISAFVSIMRGCNNMCAYCIVPFTRGRERSRDAASIFREVPASALALALTLTLTLTLALTLALTLTPTLTLTLNQVPRRRSSCPTATTS